MMEYLREMFVPSVPDRRGYPMTEDEWKDLEYQHHGGKLWDRWSRNEQAPSSTRFYVGRSFYRIGFYGMGWTDGPNRTKTKRFYW